MCIGDQDLPRSLWEAVESGVEAYRSAIVQSDEHMVGRIKEGGGRNIRRLSKSRRGILASLLFYLRLDVNVTSKKGRKEDKWRRMRSGLGL